MPAGAPKENSNAEKWSLEDATTLFNKAIEMAYEEDIYSVHGTKMKGNKYHYLGEIATSKEMKLYPDVFLYLKKTYTSLIPQYNRLKYILEANCFSDSKKGIINTATAIMNLKSNYKWTDRVDTTTKDKEVNTTTIVNLGNGVKPDETSS